MDIVEATMLALQNKLEEGQKSYGVRQAVFGDKYHICMNTYSGKRLYLANEKLHDVTSGKPISLEWVFEVEKAMVFDTKEEAEQLAKRYFKHFDRWYIYARETYLGSI